MSDPRRAKSSGDDPAIDVQIWTMRIDGLDDGIPETWHGHLSRGELVRAERFVFARNRIEYLAAHALSRWAIAGITGYHPQDLRFPTGAHGKPSAAAADGPCALEFNLSHARGMVTVALCREREVGVDVEPLSRDVNLGLADHYFNPSEVAWLQGLSDGDQRRGFLSLWTLKEAFIKATGRGLSQELHDFGFSIDPPEIFFTPALPERPEDWWFDQRIVDNGFLVACGTKAGPRQRVRFHWNHMNPNTFLDQSPAALP